MHLLYATDHGIDVYLVKALREAGHVVEVVDHPADAVEIAAGADYEAIILDWTSPRVEWAARFSAASCGLLLMMVAVGDEAERAAALKAGADACLARPIPFIELEARLEALARLVRRPGGDGGAVEMLGARQAVRLGGRTIALSGREFHLMEHFAAHAGEVIGLERLQQQVWGDNSEPRPELVRTYVSRLRRKLESAGAGASLRSVPGHGYVFEPAALDLARR
jgi:two-component system OmpR family response regulator